MIICPKDKSGDSSFGEKITGARQRGRATVGFSMRLSGILIAAALAARLAAQTPFSWQQIKEKFEAANPTLKADKLNIDESRAAEITAYLRPNPDFSFSADGSQLTRIRASSVPLRVPRCTRASAICMSANTSANCGGIRPRSPPPLRRSTYLDQERNLVFNLRNAFVAGAASEGRAAERADNLAYWDRELDVNRMRCKAGDLAQVDLNRLELQRVQFESDFETAMVNLRTAKIQLLMLLNDRTPIERFDVTGHRSISRKS